MSKIKQVAKYAVAFSAGVGVTGSIAFWTLKKFDALLDTHETYIGDLRRIAAIRDEILESYAMHVTGEQLAAVIDDTQFAWVIYQSGAEDSVTDVITAKLEMAQERALEESELSSDPGPGVDTDNADNSMVEAEVSAIVESDAHRSGVDTTDEDTGWEAERDAAVAAEAKEE